MGEIVVYESRFTTISFFPDKLLIVDRTWGTPARHELEESLQAVVDLVLHQGGRLLLADVSKLEVMFPADNDLVNKMVKEVVKAGLRRTANVLPKSVYAEMAMANWRESSRQVRPDYQSRVFDTEDEALAWLLSS